MIRFIATDMDGTLLENSALEAPAETFELIEEMAKRGIVFCAASGRQWQNLKQLFYKERNRIAYTCENGALVALASDVIQTIAIPRAMGQEIIKDILARGDQIVISGRHTCYLMDTDRKLTDHAVYGLGNTVTIVKDILCVDDEYLKISAFSNEGSSLMAQAYAPKWQDKVNAVIAGEKWFDFTVADKGKGVAAILDKLNISPDEAVAFGDNENDLAMLDYVGHPYLMASANPALRKPEYKLCNNVIEEIKRILAAQKD